MKHFSCALALAMLALALLFSGPPAGAESVLATVPTGTAPLGVAVNPYTNRVYVCNAASASVTVIDGTNNTVIATIPVGVSPYSVAVNPTTNRVYVVNDQSSTLSVINGATNTVIATVSIAGDSQSVAVNRATNRIYVSSRNFGIVAVYDGATNALITNISVPGGPYAVAVNPKTNIIYTSLYGTNGLAVLDGANNSVITSFATGTDPESVAVNPTTNKVYVCNTGSGTVSIVDGSTNAITVTVNIGNAAGAAVNPINGRVYVSSFATTPGRVYVLDAVSNAQLSFVTTGNTPFLGAVNPATGFVYFANYNGNNVSVIDPGVPSVGAAKYTVTDLGILGLAVSQGASVNSLGQVVGQAANISGYFHGFLYDLDGVMYDLGALTGNSSAASINANGQIVGTSNGSSGQRALLWTVNAGLQTISPSGATPNVANGINSLGQVTGYASFPAGFRAFLWNSSTNGIVSLGGLGGTYSEGYTINGAGQVAGRSYLAGDAGFHAFYWEPNTPNGTSGSMQDLGTLGGATSFAYGINDLGQVVGSSVPSNGGENAYLWDGYYMNSLGFLSPTGHGYSYASAVNNSQQVVGYSNITFTETPNLTSYTPHAFLYDPGNANGMVDLNTLIPSNSGWTLAHANGINDKGQIVGSGSYNNETHAYLLTPVPSGPHLSGLSIAPAEVTGGTSTTATVTLTEAAATGGFAVALSSGDPAATVPATVTVPAGATSATFSVGTTPVQNLTIAAVTATSGTDAQAATLSIDAPVPNALNFLAPYANNKAIGGNIVTATMGIDGPAPAGGLLVNLTSTVTSVATVPATVTVPAAQTSVTFSVTTIPTATDTVSSIYANTPEFGAGTSNNLTVLAPTPTALSITPNILPGGSTVANPYPTGTVTISGAAPTGGLVVALSSANTAVVQAPTTVTVLAGQTTATFTVTTIPVLNTVTVAVTASYDGDGAGPNAPVTASANMTVQEPYPTSATLTPSTVIGATSSTFAVHLTGPVPPGGLPLALSSNNPAVASVPASVTVPAGQQDVSVTVATFAVAADTNVSISAAYHTQSVARTLTVQTPTPVSVTLNPNTLNGGLPSNATLIISGLAPTGGLTVAVASSVIAAARPVDASNNPISTVVVPQGATSVQFRVATFAVAQDTTVNISASYNNITQSAALTVRTAQLLSLAFAPAAVTGLQKTVLTITLTGKAPASGATVLLTYASITPSNANAKKILPLPSSLTVPSGATSVSTTITTGRPSSSTQITVQGTYNVNAASKVKTATITVNP